MSSLGLIDVAPDPAGIGAAAVVILLVIGFVFLLAAALVVFLWFRKRSMRHQEMDLAENDGQSLQSDS